MAFDRQKALRSLLNRRHPGARPSPVQPQSGEVPLIRYVRDGEPERPPRGTTVADALHFSQERPDHLSMLLYGVPDAGEIARLAEVWDLHPVLAEDLLQGNQRPKVERYGDVLFVVARSAWYIDASESVEFAEFHLLLREDAIAVICQDGTWIDGGDVASLEHNNADAVIAHELGLLSEPELLAMGAEAVAYRLLDAIVDGYGPVLAGLATDKDQIERQVFSGDTTAAERIYRLNQEVIDLKQATSALTQVVSALKAGFSKYAIASELQSYLGDLSDHLAHVNSEVSELRESLTQILQVNATLVGQRQNEDMKKISGWAAILFAPTLIAAIYGMNFDSMPELHWGFGYPLALGMMVALAFGLYWVFKRNKWM
ncbi:magnesium and cobalt transport protein CorA [Demequina sediminicola]|uniref:magnesium and cobalt transport protein CorA n=1 Tax=Demequina sediminicola TaxID=1095026 RepID=UPI000784FC86|nr:magnesium and cobalt transport protein CorA [Demequina sediminicola]